MTLEMHENTRRKLDRLPEVLGAEFPGVSAEVVRLEIDTITRELIAEARIEDFVPVLVHRFARDHLLALGAAREVATQSWPSEGGPG
jgi:hypothetical protein